MKPPPRPFRPRRWALLLLAAAFLGVAADLILPAGPFPPREHRVILIERGETLSGVAAELKRVGLLRGTFGFQVLARLMNLDRRIKAGQYSFRLGITVPALLRALAHGMSGLNLVTITEGLTLREVGTLLARHLGVKAEAFDSLGHDRAFLDSLGVESPALEGYLAPDTYEFLPGTSPEVAFRTMVARQREVLARAAAGRDSIPLGLNQREVLTLASIVESEAQMNDERPKIARVYLNRLNRGMRLQADPTVAYAVGLTPRSRLFLRQLRAVSPYNTYLNEGLPPGPICNPGAASVRAVFGATPGLTALYFVAKGDGRHYFSDTYEQHLAYIAIARAAQSAPPAGSLMDSAGARADTSARRLPAKADTVVTVPARRPARADTVPAKRKPARRASAPTRR